MNIRDIFRSIDLWNNKILRAKCELPSDPEHIVNKTYVDEITNYNTPKALKYKKPFLQWWMSDNIFGFTFKQVFDDLLFPRLAPKYVNPTLDCITFDVTNNELVDDVQYIGNKKLLFYDLTYDFHLRVNLKDLDDRLPVSDMAYVQVVYPDAYVGENKTFKSTGTSATDIEIELSDIRFVRGMKFLFSKQFNNAKEIKNDTYGDPSIPTDFSLGYKLEIDLTDIIYEQIVAYDTPYIGVRNDEHTPFEFVVGNTYTKADVMSSTYHSYVQGVRFDVSNTEQNHRHILIPETLYNQMILQTVYFKRIANGATLPEYKNELTHQMLTDISQDVINIITGTGESVRYKMCHLELGRPVETHLCRLMFEFIFKAYNNNDYYSFYKNKN